MKLNNNDIEKFIKLTKEEMELKPPTKADLIGEGEVQLIPFKNNGIRRKFHDGEWFYSIIDIVSALCDTDTPEQYWVELKSQIAEKDSFYEINNKILQLTIDNIPTEVVNPETIFRIIQSVSTPKAEPFKKWLAKIAYERIKEYQNPEIAIKRALLTYKVKGYSDEWINARIQTIISRKELTNEWEKRGISEKIEYALLTDTISEGSFELKIKEHKQLKGLKKNHNLRDHMSPLELALTMLGETTTAEIARATNAQGFKDNKKAAEKGGKIAGDTRKSIEKQINRPVVTSENYLKISGDKKNIGKV